MRLDHRLRRLEARTQALPAPELPSLLDAGRTDMEIMRLLLKCAQWQEANPGVDPDTVPECVERDRELARRYGAVLEAQGYTEEHVARALGSGGACEPSGSGHGDVG